MGTGVINIMCVSASSFVDRARYRYEIYFVNCTRTSVCRHFQVVALETNKKGDEKKLDSTMARAEDAAESGGPKAEGETEKEKSECPLNPKMKRGECCPDEDERFFYSKDCNKLFKSKKSFRNLCHPFFTKGNIRDRDIWIYQANFPY